MIYSIRAILAFNAYVSAGILFLNNLVVAEKWNLNGTPGNGYYISVQIGDPPQNFNLLIDSGSSNLAIAGSSYPGVESYFIPSKSKSFVENGTPVEVAYTQGWWKGIMGKDVVQIPSLKDIPRVVADLSIINSTHGFYINNSHWQGILGLAYSEIAKPEGLVESWFDKLASKYPKQINNRFDLELCGPRKFPHRDLHYGRISVGDKKHICLKSEYSTPIHHRWYYEVIVTGFNVGNCEINIPCHDFNSPKTIVDSGTSNLQLSSKSFFYVISELKRQTQDVSPPLSQLFWEGKDAICFPPNEEPWDLFPSLTVFLKHDNYSHFGIQVPPVSYLRPALNESNQFQECWLFGIEKSHIGTVLGTVLLEGLCLVFNREDGFLHFSKSETSCGPNVIILPILNKTDSTSCDFAVYVMNGPLIAALIILLIVLLPLVIAFARYILVEFLYPRTVTDVSFISLDENNT